MSMSIGTYQNFTDTVQVVTVAGVIVRGVTVTDRTGKGCGGPVGEEGEHLLQQRHCKDTN